MRAECVLVYGTIIWLMLLKQTKADLRIGSRNETIDQFIDRLVRGAAGNIRPGLETDTTTAIQVSIYVLGFSAIDQINMDYSLNFFLRSIWKDPRLAHSDYNDTLTLNYLIDKIWTPDIYFINEKEGRSHTITQPNRLMQLSPDGTLRYSQKLTVKLACFMKLHAFPHDNQTCSMKLESYGYTMKELMLEWVGMSNAVEFSDDLELPEFRLTGKDIGYCTKYYFTGNFSCLYATFHLERLSGYYVIQTYVPSVLIVILSWVSFWIDHRAIPARISLGLLTILSITTQSSGALSQLPRVSYVKAIDIWMATCLSFVFAGLIEFAFVNYVARLELDKKLEKEAMEKEIQEMENEDIILKNIKNSEKEPLNSSNCDVTKEIPSHLSINDSPNKMYFESTRMYHISSPENNHVSAKLKRRPRRQLCKCCQQLSMAERMDYFARISFPVAFILFNVVYWAYFVGGEL